MVKRSLIVMLILSALSFSCAIFAVRSGDWEYGISGENEAIINSYYGNETHLEIPNTIDGYKVTKIGTYAFRGRTDLISITIPDGVKSLSWGVFYGCSSLTSITFPDSMESIGHGAIYAGDDVFFVDSHDFYDCKKLESINISKDSPYYVVEDGVLFNKDKSWLIFCPASKTGEYIIPDSVKLISDSAFDGCSGLTSLTLSVGLEFIDDSVFRGCSSLTSVVIPDSVSRIGYYAFKDCTNLTSITIPDSVTSIKGYAFENCVGLNDIKIPNKVIEIEGGAFSGCSGLTSLNIPSSVTKIGGNAFSDCSDLKSITILADVPYDNIGYQYVYGTLYRSIAPPSIVYTGDLFSGCSEDLVIYTLKNSGIDQYAKENELKVEYID